MKITTQTQIKPSEDQLDKLVDTVRVFNKAANWLAEQAFNLKQSNAYKLHYLFYYKLREKFNLTAQIAVRCIARVSHAYSLNLKIKPEFRENSSIPFDAKSYSLKGNILSVSTLQGREKFQLIMGTHQSNLFQYKKGQCDLLKRKDGKWFVNFSVTVPQNERSNINQYLGIDLGIVNILTDSDGVSYSGEAVKQNRIKTQELRSNLQKKAAELTAQSIRPKNVKRKLKSISKRESNFKKDINHQLSKTVVNKAKGTNLGIALEDLSGIRNQKTVSKALRINLNNWSFYQLRTFIEYKAKRAGVPVSIVSAKYTSQTCSNCGHCSKDNRKNQSEFNCTHCGLKLNADYNAAINISKAAATQPIVSLPL